MLRVLCCECEGTVLFSEDDLHVIVTPLLLSPSTTLIDKLLRSSLSLSLSLSVLSHHSRCSPIRSFKAV